MHHAIYGASIDPWPEPIGGRPRISALTGRQRPVDLLPDGPERSLRCAQDRPGPKELPSTGPGRCRRPQQECPSSPFVFVSERGSPFTTAGFARMIERTAAGAGLELKAHPHMLRHACGYALANKGHDTRAIQGWLGHRSITSTAVYTALAPNRFKDFWQD
jgi:integrase